MSPFFFGLKDELDLLRLADIIEGKEFFNNKDEFGNVKGCLPKDKRDGTQFSLQNWFFDCEMPACVGGHGFVEFPKRFSFLNTNSKAPFIGPRDFGRAFNLVYDYAYYITMPSEYKSKNPNPKTVAKRIREIVSQIKLENTP